MCIAVLQNGGPPALFYVNVMLVRRVYTEVTASIGEFVFVVVSSEMLLLGFSTFLVEIIIIIF